MNHLIKFLLTALLVSWVILPFYSDTEAHSVLGEIYRLGVWPASLIMAAFFIMVACYCRTIQQCYTLIRPENRKATPQSVWYMFAIPFNFVADFFIVINLANTLEAEKRTNPRLHAVKDFGMVSGIGWSIAQVMSFIPNIVGQLAGLLGMILVIVHWVQIYRIKKLLQTA